MEPPCSPDTYIPASLRPSESMSNTMPVGPAATDRRILVIQRALSASVGAHRMQKLDLRHPLTLVRVVVSDEFGVDPQLAALGLLGALLESQAGQKLLTQHMGVLWNDLVCAMWKGPPTNVRVSTGLRTFLTSLAGLLMPDPGPVGGSMADLLYQWFVPVLTRGWAKRGEELTPLQVQSSLQVLLGGITGECPQRGAKETMEHPPALHADFRNMVDLLLGWGLDPSFPPALRLFFLLRRAPRCWLADLAWARSLLASLALDARWRPGPDGTGPALVVLCCMLPIWHGLAGSPDAHIVDEARAGAAATLARLRLRDLAADPAVALAQLNDLVLILRGLGSLLGGPGEEAGAARGLHEIGDKGVGVEADEWLPCTDRIQATLRSDGWQARCGGDRRPPDLAWSLELAPAPGPLAELRAQAAALLLRALALAAPRSASAAGSVLEDLAALLTPCDGHIDHGVARQARSASGRLLGLAAHPVWAVRSMAAWVYAASQVTPCTEVQACAEALRSGGAAVRGPSGGAGAGERDAREGRRVLLTRLWCLEAQCRGIPDAAYDRPAFHVLADAVVGAAAADADEALMRTVLLQPALHAPLVRGPVEGLETTPRTLSPGDPDTLAALLSHGVEALARACVAARLRSSAGSAAELFGSLEAALGACSPGDEPREAHAAARGDELYPAPARAFFASNIGELRGRFARLRAPALAAAEALRLDAHVAAASYAAVLGSGGAGLPQALRLALEELHAEACAELGDEAGLATALEACRSLARWTAAAFLQEDRRKDGAPCAVAAGADARALALSGPTWHEPGCEHVRVAGFASGTVDVLQTKTRPKLVHLLGEDGVARPFLLKGREDAAAHAWLLRLADLTRRAAASASPTLRDAAPAYGLLPLGPRAALVQWLPRVTPLMELHSRAAAAAARQAALAGEAAAAARDGRAFDPAVERGVPRPPRAAEAFKAALRAQGVDPAAPRAEWPASALRAVFARLQHGAASDFIAARLLAGAWGPGDWVGTGWVLGVGDRHLDNILLRERDGRLTHVDFDLVFDRGRELNVPETVPFRLTRCMLLALGPVGAGGPFAGACHATLGALRSHADVMLGALGVALDDPGIRWRVEGAQAGVSGLWAKVAVARADALRLTSAARTLERLLPRMEHALMPLGMHMLGAAATKKAQDAGTTELEKGSKADRHAQDATTVAASATGAAAAAAATARSAAAKARERAEAAGAALAREHPRLQTALAESEVAAVAHAQLLDSLLGPSHGGAAALVQAVDPGAAPALALGPMVAGWRGVPPDALARARLQAAGTDAELAGLLDRRGHCTLVLAEALARYRGVAALLPPGTIRGHCTLVLAEALARYRGVAALLPPGTIVRTTFPARGAEAARAALGVSLGEACARGGDGAVVRATAAHLRDLAEACRQMVEGKGGAGREAVREAGGRSRSPPQAWPGLEAGAAPGSEQQSLRSASDPDSDLDALLGRSQRLVLGWGSLALDLRPAFPSDLLWGEGRLAWLAPAVQGMDALTTAAAELRLATLTPNDLHALERMMGVLPELTSECGEVVDDLSRFDSSTLSLYDQEGAWGGPAAAAFAGVLPDILAVPPRLAALGERIAELRAAASAARGAGRAGGSAPRPASVRELIPVLLAEAAEIATSCDAWQAATPALLTLADEHRGRARLLMASAKAEEERRGLRDEVAAAAADIAALAAGKSLEHGAEAAARPVPPMEADLAAAPRPVATSLFQAQPRAKPEWIRATMQRVGGRMQGHQPVEVEVAGLVRQATNPSALAAMYEGWMAWV
ncbi:Serine/threonine-protein kinase SMG1 [Auxenochlorella protothecoides]|uniref:Serine/threonine-protein kinase SMG1 n=1 Tax=Auxenochlorella protothecoides TaxID=3075 RepID=A0A087SNM0_AUXPR|nr:Serine/threonine-protein kinase SMG1 [Auxenochlorella protothecoides]KFM27324.1 Serine/threonine-protein kinase SMG1 [Auxenochlorella protothecoides]